MIEVKLYVVNRDPALPRLGLLRDATLDNVKWELCRPGELDFTIDPLSKHAMNIQLMKTEVQLWLRDTEANPPLPNWLAWQGIPLRAEGDEGGLTFSCEGLLSYFKYRMVDTGSWLFTDIEQIQIIVDLIEYVQNGTDRDLHIEIANFVPSGRNRSRDYSRWEHISIYEAMEEFPDLEGGFEYDIRLYPDGRREWTPYYPKKGSYKENLVLEWGKNLKGYNYKEDAVDMANQIYVSGGSAGEVKFEQNWTDVAAREEYGLLQGVVSEGQQKDVTWLLDKAKQEVAERKTPIITPRLETFHLPVRYLGNIETGDTFPVKINHGRIQVQGDYRVQTIEWSPEDDTVEIGVGT